MVLGGHRARSAKRARSLLRSEPQERKTWSRMFCRFEAKGVPTVPESEYDGQPLRLHAGKCEFGACDLPDGAMKVRGLPSRT